MRSSFLLTTLAVVCFFCSCSKEDSPANPEKTPEKNSMEKRPITFKLPGFSQEVGDFRKAPTDGAQRDSLLETQIDQLLYFAYDAAGNEVSAFTQALSDASFGLIKDSLAPGGYTIVILATKGWNPLMSNNPHLPLADAGLRLNWSMGLAQANNTFFTKFPITINSTDTAVTANVSLDRVVGKLEVNILDMPWAGSNDQVVVEVSPESSTFSFSTATCVSTDSIVRTMARHPEIQNQFSEFILNTETAFTVTVRYIHYYSGEVNVKTIHNVRCYKNKRTILTGNALDGTPNNPPADGGGFKVSVNDVWDPNDEVIDF